MHTPEELRRMKRAAELEGHLIDQIAARAEESLSEKTCREWMERQQAREADQAQQGEALSQFHQKVRDDHGRRVEEQKRSK